MARTCRQQPRFSVIVRTNARPPRRPPPEAERSFSSSAANTFAGRRLTRNRRGLFSIVTVSPIRIGSKMSAMAMTSTVTHMSGRATCRLIVVRPGFGARPRPGKDGERW